MVRNNNNSTYHDTKLTYSSITRVKENFLRKKLQLVLKVIYLWYTSFFNKHHNLKLLAELIKKKQFLFVIAILKTFLIKNKIF